MNLGHIVNPEDEGGIQTAISVSSMPADERPDAPHQRDASHKGQRSGIFLASNAGPKYRPQASTWRPGKSSAPKRRPRRRTKDKQQRVRGGAEDAIPIRDSPSCDTAIRPCHLRHGQPRPSAGDPPYAPHVVASPPAWSASLPPSSPAVDLPRRIETTPSVDTAWLGRKPLVLNTTLPGPRSAAHVHDHSQDAIREAIERSEAALRPAHAQRRFKAVCDLEDGRSFELYWEAQAARVRLAAREREMMVPQV